jgi:MFS family permease
VRLYILGWLFVIFEYAVRVSDSVILPTLQLNYHLSAAQLAELSSAYYLTYIIAMLPAGILIDRISLYRSWSAAISILTLGCFLFAYADSLMMLVLARILMGLGSSFAIIGVFSCAVKEKKHSGLLIGLTMLMAMLGAVIGQGPWLQLTLVLKHWSSAYLIAGGFGVLLLILWMVLGRYCQQHATSSNWSDVRAGLHALLKSPIFWLLAILIGCLSSPQTAFMAFWGPTFLKLTYHISLIRASYFTSFITIGGLLGAILFGWLSDIYSNIKPWLIVCLVGTTILFVVMIQGDVTSHVLLAGLLFLLGVLTNANTMVFAFLGKKFARVPTATVQGSANIFNMLGGPVFQLLIGWVVTLQRTNIYLPVHQHALQLSLWSIPICLAVLALVLLFFPQNLMKNMGPPGFEPGTCR